MASLRDWAQLVRVPNTLTACADAIAGASLVVGSWSAFAGQLPFAISLLTVSVSSICFYWAGMVLNDVADVEKDRLQRRPGPIATNRITWRSALQGGVVLMILGLVLAIAIAWGVPSSFGVMPRAVVVSVALLLAMSIVGYDFWFKSTRIAPLLMGVCRGLNMLLGASVGMLFVSPSSEDIYCLSLAVLGHTAFVTGITLAARRESVLSQSRSRLGVGWTVSLIGVLLIACCAFPATNRVLNFDSKMWFALLVVVLMLPWIKRAIDSITTLEPRTLGSAIKQAIFSIIFLDAAVTVEFAGNVPGAVVCALIFPTILLGRYFRST